MENSEEFEKVSNYDAVKPNELDFNWTLCIIEDMIKNNVISFEEGQNFAYSLLMGK